MKATHDIDDQQLIVSLWSADKLEEPMVWCEMNVYQIGDGDLATRVCVDTIIINDATVPIHEWRFIRATPTQLRELADAIELRQAQAKENP